jgi:hypothetical protein
VQLASDLAVILLLPLALFAAIDGVYLHLWRLRLHERPECRREHLLHTARALLFPVGLTLVYDYSTTSSSWFLGLAVVAADTALEAWDTFEERNSRRTLGGLSSGEALLHVVLVTLRAASLALALVARPTATSGWHGVVVYQLLLPGAVLVAALHVGLAFRWPCCFRLLAAK